MPCFARIAPAAQGPGWYGTDAAALAGTCIGGNEPVGLPAGWRHEIHQLFVRGAGKRPRTAPDRSLLEAAYSLVRSCGAKRSRTTQAVREIDAHPSPTWPTANPSPMRPRHASARGATSAITKCTTEPPRSVERSARNSVSVLDGRDNTLHPVAYRHLALDRVALPAEFVRTWRADRFPHRIWGDGLADSADGPRASPAGRSPRPLRRRCGVESHARGCQLPPCGSRPRPRGSNRRPRGFGLPRRTRGT